MDARQWLAAYAEALGLAGPTEDEITALLALAGDAAHGSERIAAPVACWLAARSGLPLGEAAARAAGIAAGGS